MAFTKTFIPIVLVWLVSFPLYAAPTLTLTYAGYSSKPVTGVKIVITESGGAVTILSTDTNGQVTLPTAGNSFTLAASLAETGEDPVDLLDAIWILQHSGELRTLTTEQLKAADVSGDGEVDLLDAIYILQHSGELRTLSPSLVFLDANTGNLLSTTTFNATDTPSISVVRTGDVDQGFDPTLITDHAPILTGKTTLSIAENETSIATLIGTDADADTLTYEITGGVDKALFSINTSTGALSFIAGPDYEDPGDSGGDNLYNIEISVSDGTNDTSQALIISVADVGDTGPVISNLAATVSVEENQTSVVTVSASDPDGDTLTYTLSGTDASSFSISSSGVITFDSAPDYETKTSYSVTVTVSDGSLTTTQTLTINVTNVNDISPVISSSASFSAAENQTSVGTVSASDAEDDSLTYTLSGTDASSFSISSSGVITFDSAPNYETKTSYSVTVTVSDGVNTASQDINILITYDYKYPTHWNNHQENLNKIRTVYTNEIGFNIEEIWFKTLSIPKDKFTTTRFDYFKEAPRLKGQVGVDSWFNVGNKTFYYHCNWSSTAPSEGGIKVFVYLEGEFNQFIYKEIEGCNHPFSIKSKDGSSQVIFMALDEGKKIAGEAFIGQTYTFDLDTYEFTDIGYDFGSHGQAVFDYEGDSDEDIISNDFGNEVSDGQPFILRNDGKNNFNIVKIPLPNYREGDLDHSDRFSTMSASAFYENSYLNVVYTDFNVANNINNEWGIELNKNVLVKYDQNTLSVVDVIQLPTPYSELNFTNIEPYAPSWLNGNGISHDVRSTPIDIDYDGDIDILIGSQVYGEDISLPQILINNNGVYEDETSSRLYNWMYATGSIHRWDFADINGDGYLDIITKDNCIGLFQDSTGEIIDVDKQYGCERKVAINDGDGHFVVIIEPAQIMQIFEGNEYKFYRIHPIFAMDSDRNLSWVSMDGKDCNGCYANGDWEIFTTKLDGALSTGPVGMNPDIRGEPGFNEFYYLLHNPEAKKAVTDGVYENGLEHYIAIGKDLGYQPNAKKQTNVVVNSYGVNPVYSVE